MVLQLLRAWVPPAAEWVPQTGFVEDVGWYQTLVRGYDGRVLAVPNSLFAGRMTVPTPLSHARDDDGARAAEVSAELGGASKLSKLGQQGRLAALGCLLSRLTATACSHRNLVNYCEKYKVKRTAP